MFFLGGCGRWEGKFGENAYKIAIFAILYAFFSYLIWFSRKSEWFEMKIRGVLHIKTAFNVVLYVNQSGILC